MSSLTRDLYWRDDADRKWLAHLVIVFQQLFEDWDRDPKLRVLPEGEDALLCGQAPASRRRRIDAE